MIFIKFLTDFQQNKKQSYDCFLFCCLCPQEESNFYQWLRKPLFYPLNYGDIIYFFNLKYPSAKGYDGIIFIIILPRYSLGAICTISSVIHLSQNGFPGISYIIFITLRFLSSKPLSIVVANGYLSTLSPLLLLKTFMPVDFSASNFLPIQEAFMPTTVPLKNPSGLASGTVPLVKSA